MSSVNLPLIIGALVVLLLCLLYKLYRSSSQFDLDRLLSGENADRKIMIEVVRELKGIHFWLAIIGIPVLVACVILLLALVLGIGAPVWFR